MVSEGNTKLEERLKPYEKAITWIQEVLFLKRPLIMVGIVIAILVSANFLRQMGAGAFATIAFCLCVAFVISVLYRLAWSRIEPHIAAPLPTTTEKYIYSLAEICDALEKISTKWKRSTEGRTNSLFVGLLCLFCAFALRKVRAFYFTVTMLLLALFMPWICFKSPVSGFLKQHYPNLDKVHAE
jgi:hypothetical protein